MCTSLTLPTADGRHLFGRTLDLDDHFGESVTLTPRRYSFSFADCYPHTHHYALLGMATVADGSTAIGYPLYAEAMNEKGLCMAGLRFARSAVYAQRPQAGLLNLAPWELIPYLLGTCATVDEVRAALGDVCIVDKPFSDKVGTAPLHWHVADADPSHGGLILEITADGMKLYSDEAGTLTNDPSYPVQTAALESYRFARGDVPGLPGDYSSSSRFVRGATLRRWWLEAGMSHSTEAEKDAAGKHGVAQFFSILGAVSPTAGAVMTPAGACHRTLYTCCMDTATGTYHYRPEGEVSVRAISFAEYDLNGETVMTLEG